MTALKDWFHFNRKETNIAKAANDLGFTATYLVRVVNGHRRASIQLAKALEKYTGGAILWHDILSYPDNSQGAD